MKKRILSFVLALSLVASVLPITAMAAAPEICPHCGTSVQWQGLSAVADDAASIEAGHYYYDYAMADHAFAKEKSISGKVCIYIDSGKTLTAQQRVFKVAEGGELTICGAGSVCAGNFDTTQADTVTLRAGGAINVAAGGILNLYDATLTDVKSDTRLQNASNGGVVAVSGTFNMYSGLVTGGTASNAGANVYIYPTGYFYALGGTVDNGTILSGGAGKSVYSKGRVILGGNASIGQLYMRDDDVELSQLFALRGAYTGNSTILFRNVAYTEGMILGAAENASLLRGTLKLNTTSGSSGMYIMVDGGVLKATATEPSITKLIYCQHCKQDIAFKPLTESAAGETSLSSGHYYLDVLNSDPWAAKTIASGSTVCLDLNGQSLQATSRFFNVKGSLSVQGEGTLTGGGFNTAAVTVKSQRNGGIFHVTGSLEVYGGTFKAGKYGDSNSYGWNGGVIYSNKNVAIYGGTFAGQDVGNIGDCIYNEATGSLQLLGGKFTGPSYAIYNKGSVTLSGDADAEYLEMRYDANGPDITKQLTITGDYHGTATIHFHETHTAALGEGAVVGISEEAYIRHASLIVLDQDKKTVNLNLLPKNGQLILTSETAEPETKEGYCSACEKNATWTALMEDFASAATLEAGHYYLDFGSGSCLWAEKVVMGDVCLDLNGMTLTGKNRVFCVENKSVMNILGAGTLIGRGQSTSDSTSKRQGGTIYVQNHSVVNLYEATLLNEKVSKQNAANGGIVYVAGTFNMYGGIICDGYASNCGGNIYVDPLGQLNLYGGEVTGGTIASGGASKCIGNSGKVMLSGNATVTELQHRPKPEENGPAQGDMLEITGTYTGSVDLRASSAKIGLDVGNAPTADLSGANITVYGSACDTVMVHGGDLILVKNTANVMIMDGTSVVGNYASLEAAMEAYTNNAHKIVLYTDVTDVVLTKDVYLDLNGHKITGSVTGNGTLYCMDSYTDDLTVSDGVYGSAPACAKVKAVPQESACSKDGYLMVTGADNTVSFHRVILRITTMTLKSSRVGLYLSCAIDGDELVKAQVKNFGVALRVDGDPKLGNSQTMATANDPAAFGTGKTNSVLVYNIMREELSSAENAERAAMNVQGRAYVEFNGGIMYGACRGRTLEEQVAGNYDEEGNLTWVGADQMIDGMTYAQQNGLYGMYIKFKDTMDNWNIPVIKESSPQTAEELAQLIADSEILQARRDAVIAKMRAMGDIYWRATENVSYTISSSSSGRKVRIVAGRVYRGIPYTYARSDESSFMEFTGEQDEKGIYTVSGLTSDLLATALIRRVSVTIVPVL